MKALCISLLVIASHLVCGQTTQDEPSTEQLSFLIGSWQIDRTYSLGTDSERKMSGTMECRYHLNDQFINCLYETFRPDKSNVLDDVYFNYNPIYGKYESVWLASSWPIKVVVSVEMKKEGDSIILLNTAEFPISDDIIEQVSGKLEYSDNAFIRNTHIRTSKDEPDVWKHHMVEVAKKLP